MRCLLSIFISFTIPCSLFALPFPISNRGDDLDPIPTFSLSNFTAVRTSKSIPFHYQPNIC